MKFSLINDVYNSVAKRKSLFDDRPAEIQELTYIIKGDLNSLNQQIGRLQEISKSQRKTSGKHLLSHSSNMVMALQTRLANMSTNFQQVLEVRTENLKQQKTRREQVKVRSSLRSADLNNSLVSVLTTTSDCAYKSDEINTWKSSIERAR